MLVDFKDTTWIFVFLAISFLAIRLYPLWPNRERGCDAYYFLLCAEILRKERLLPIRLPSLYLAEPQEQWYPPAFPMFLALVPPSFLKRWHWILNHVLDFAVAAVLFLVVRIVAGDVAAVASVILYALQFGLIQEFATLTSRPLGMLMQLVAVIAAYGYVEHGSPVGGVLAVVAVALLVYAHKLSLQLLWFLFPFLAIVTGAWEWLAFLAVGYLLAFVVWPGFFLKIQRAHLDILRFWGRNWPLLGAHPVRQSPLYGSQQTRTNYYDKRMMGTAWKFVKNVGQLNVFTVFLPVGLVVPVQGVAFADFCWWWATGIYLWAAATYFIPHLRALGLGQQYVKFGYLPVLAFTASYLVQSESFWPWVLFALCTALVVRWYIFNTVSLRASSDRPETGQVSELLAWIGTLQAPRLMLFPYHLADEIAYRGRVPVLWGTHGYGFKQVETFFPVLREPLSTVVGTFKISHIVLDSRYVNPQELKLDPTAVTARIGRFLVFEAARVLREAATVESRKAKPLCTMT